MDDFIVGVYEASKELGSPFVTESIWTQALADLYFRKGRTPEGFKVFDDEDPIGTKVRKSIAHLIEAQAPLNWKQLKRLKLSTKPINDVGRFDDRGMESSNNPNQSDLFKAMFLISRTGKGPVEQTPSIGCSIKWRE